MKWFVQRILNLLVQSGIPGIVIKKIGALSYFIRLNIGNIVHHYHTSNSNMSTSSDLSPNSDFSLANITVDFSVNFDQSKENFLQKPLLYLQMNLKFLSDHKLGNNMGMCRSTWVHWPPDRDHPSLVIMCRVLLIVIVLFWAKNVEVFWYLDLFYCKFS